LWLAFVAVAISGCGYKAGRTPPNFGSGLETVAVPIFENISREPLIETALTEVVREELINDGRLEVVPQPKADLILKGRITDYWTRTLAFDASDRASEVRVTIDVRFDLVEREGGKELASFDLQARSEYAVSDKLSELEKAKEAAELRAFRELAEELTQVLLSGLL
jgi:outer membrane lipopolysaccharide assembly protein LptE/RlpB